MLKVENREFDFSMMTTADVFKAKNAMIAMGLAKSVNDSVEANSILDELALKYVKVRKDDGKWVEKLDKDTISLYFKDESSLIEISFAFMQKVQGFLAKSPSFQQFSTANHQ